MNNIELHYIKTNGADKVKQILNAAPDWCTHIAIDGYVELGDAEYSDPHYVSIKKLRELVEA